MKQIIFFFLSLALGFLTACSTTKTTGTGADPLEAYNRTMTNFNFKVNRYIYKPARKAYHGVIPEFARDRINNFSSNLGEPYTCVNALLQGDFNSAGQSIGRFFTNTVLGGLGLFDVASHFDIEKPNNDFGQTLYKWGWQDSVPYIVLPFLGPSDLRDTLALGASIFMNPLDYLVPKADRNSLRLARYSTYAISLIDGGSVDLLENIENTSLDPYTSLRTMYQQNRQKKLLQGQEETKTQTYDFDFDLDEEEN